MGDEIIHLRARNGAEAYSPRNAASPRTLTLLRGRLEDRKNHPVDIVVAVLGEHWVSGPVR